MTVKNLPDRRTRRYVVKQERVKAGLSWSANTVILTVGGIIGLLVLLVGVAVIAALLVLQAGFYRVSEDAATIISEHPALALAGLAHMNHEGSTPVDVLAMVSELSANAAINGSFKGHWSNTTERYLEKENLDCIENYTYYQVWYGDKNYSLNVQTLKDAGCEEYNVNKQYVTINASGNWEYQNMSGNPPGVSFKCSQHYCSVIERTREVPGVFIPDSVDVRSIGVATNGIGKR